jgi:sarcosine oxidase delta subunit
VRPVERREIVDYVSYEDTREAFRRQVLAEKAPRRVHVGPCLTFLFENRDTIRYQVQEMMRAERSRPTTSCSEVRASWARRC